MRHLKLFSSTLWLTMAMLAIAWTPEARADRTVNQLQFGKQTIEVGADETITFYDMNGTGNISSSSSNNSHSMTVFKPAAGMAIQLTFEKVDAHNDGTSYPNYVNVYAGDPDPDNTFVWATTTSGVTKDTPMPEGNLLEHLDGTYYNKTYVGNDGTGIISVGYLYRYAATIEGWVATVKCITLDDMTVTGASTNYDNVVAAPDATSGVNFASFNVTATGIMNADVVKKVTFSVTSQDNAVDPLSLRLYKGSKASFKGESSIHESITADGNLYSFTLNEALSDGDNLFSIAGDFLGSATPGATAQVEITKIVTETFPDGVTPFTAGSPVAVTKPAIAQIALSPQTVTVGEINYNFYDDGGKDGNISQGFEGQITFVPATEGHAIKIDFTKLDLFTTSTIEGYNDVFKFYNGREVNEENLIATLFDEAEIVKSTADDGSITVYLKSTAGYPKSGWEAVVSQFLPGDMTVNSVGAEADSQSTATVTAGETDARMLVVDVITDNQANPLSLSEIKLQTTTADRLTGYTVYYLGKKNVFATSNVFATGEATANIVATGSQELVEGHNYFAIAANVDGTLNNGDQLSLSVSGVTVAGVEYPLESAVGVMRTVQNVCRATQGSHSHDIYGDWTFTNTESYSGSGKYEAENTDYIVTFYPKVDNSMVEIDFSAFDIYYPSTNYGYETKPEFVIYSGNAVNTSNILWQLQSKDQATTGPGRKLRSNAADGSMTIRFNPKTTSSYYTATGWTATVTPFVNHDMEVKNVVVNQTSSDDLGVGTADAALIDFVVETEGTLTTKVFNKVNLDLKDSQNALSKVSVFYNNENNRENAVLFGAVENLAQSTVTVNGERALADGMNYFWVTVDVKADAAANAVVDAKLVSLVDNNDVATEVANGDPEGERVVKYLYVIQSGTQTVTVTEPLLFYDDGGKDGKLTKGFKGTVIFVPGRDNSAVQINTLNTFSIGSGKMYVYSGREANDANKLGSVTGYSTTTGPANLVSKAEDGSLTVVFEANTTASTLDGWEMEVSLHEKTPFVIEEVEIDNTEDAIVRGSHDNVMQQIALVVSGDKEPITISSREFATTGTTNVADIANVKVYSTGHNTLFRNDNLLANATVSDGNNTITFDTPLTITENGNYYLWLTYDLSEDAGVANNVAAKVSKIGENVTVTGDAAVRTIKSGLKGNYIIGASDAANFATFAAALEALAGGVEGDVTFQVEDGTYNENIQFAAIPGAGENAKITFTSLSGDRDKVIVAGSGNTENLPGSTAYKKGMVFIENTPYVTLEKLSFIPASESTYNYAVQIYDRSRHFTLRDCHVKATNVTSGYSGMYLVQMTPVNEEGRNNDYATIENNLIEGGYMGLNVGGTSYVAYTMEQGLVVSGNTINEGTKAIQVSPGIGTVIENNTIYQSKIQKTGYWGIDAMRLRGAFVIAGNKIVSETSYYSGGIQLRMDTYGNENAPGRVYNNVISITKSPSTSSAGIQLDPSTHNVEIVNNSVRIGNTKGYAFYMSNSTSGAAANIKLQNNLFQNETESPVMFVGDRWFGNLTFTNNSFYCTSGSVKDGVDLDAFNALDNVESTIAVQAEFVSETNLHLTAGEGLKVATPLDWLTVDADGVERDATAPTLGAYEYVEVIDNKPELAEGNYPAVSDVTDNSASVVTKWTEGGKLYAKVEKVEKVETPAADGARRLKAVSADDLLETEPATILADTEVTTEFTELESSSDYVAYLMAVSDLGTASDVVTVDFTTARHIDPLTATIAAVAATIDEGESATITATISGGDEPYTIEWRDQMNNVVGNEATITVTPDYTYGYRMTVTSADGQTATAKTAVIVRGDAVPANFEDNYLAEESFFNGDNDDDTWYSGSYAFAVGNAIWPNTTISFWYDYALSNQTSTAYTGLDDQYHSVTGGGHNSSNFVIAYPQGGSISVTHDAAGDVISGFYITNTAYAYYYLLNDNGEVSHAMRQGDWFKVTVKDIDNNNNSLDFYLSDFRSENEADHYNINQWEWVDLTPLGNVKGVTFTFSGSDTGKWGLNTPAYFAMDNFGGERDFINVTKVIKAQNNQKINLGEIFEYTRAVATINYNLEGDLSNDMMDISLDSENNQLIVNAKQDHCEQDVIVGMTQKGHTQYAKITIKVDNVTAINEIAADSDIVKVEYVNVAGQVSGTPWQGVNIVVRHHSDGSVTKTKEIR